jgi:hypothetical protein
MAKKFTFTFLWVAAGFVAAVIGLLVAPLVPRLGITREHTPAAMTLVSIAFALLPFVGMGIPLLLGLRGKLPGTKRDGAR